MFVAFPFGKPGSTFRGNALGADVHAAQPLEDLRQCSSLLIGLQDERIENPRTRRVLSHGVHAPALAVTAMYDERDEGFPGEIVLREKGPDDRGRGLSPDGKSKERCLVRTD